MSFGVVGNTTFVSVKAPDLGSFPLDHYRECKDEIGKYYTCMKDNKYVAPRCRDEVREYLQCRMDRGLMKKADISGFGMPETEFVPNVQHKSDIKEQWYRYNMTGLNPLFVERFKRDDLNVPDGYEVERDGKSSSPECEPSPLPNHADNENKNNKSKNDNKSTLSVSQNSIVKRMQIILPFTHHSK